MLTFPRRNIQGNWVHLCIYGHGHALDFLIQQQPLIQMCSSQLPMHKDILDLVLN